MYQSLRSETADLGLSFVLSFISRTLQLVEQVPTQVFEAHRQRALRCCTCVLEARMGLCFHSTAWLRIQRFHTYKS